MSTETKWGGGRVFALDGVAPRVADDVFLAPGVVVIGDVDIGAGSSIWFNCVLRADVESIRIGRGANIQDGSIIHADEGYPAIIGDHALIGHAVMLHGATVEHHGFVGMGATLLNGAIVGSDAMLGAGALLTGGKMIGPRQLWAGRPAKLVRDLSDAQISDMRQGTRHYAKNAQRYRADLREI